MLGFASLLKEVEKLWKSAEPPVPERKCIWMSGSTWGWFHGGEAAIASVQYEPRRTEL